MVIQLGLKYLFAFFCLNMLFYKAFSQKYVELMYGKICKNDMKADISTTLSNNTNISID